MERPINIFYDFLKSIKDLVVSVKIGKAKATLYGVVLAQLSKTTFRVEDDKGNQGVCKLVDKHKDDLKDNEMSITGYILKSTTFVFISSVAQGLIKDFKNNVYTYEVDNDSASSILLLTEAT